MSMTKILGDKRRKDQQRKEVEIGQMKIICRRRKPLALKPLWRERESSRERERALEREL